MASAAQIEANRRNCQKSTGPKTESGKAKSRRNALTHGMTARTIMPVLPQEDPKELEAKTQQTIAALKPSNPLEIDLICRAVRLSWIIDRTERAETAHLGHQIRMTAVGAGDGYGNGQRGRAQEDSRARQQAVL